MNAKQYREQRDRLKEALQRLDSWLMQVSGRTPEDNGKLISAKVEIERALGKRND